MSANLPYSPPTGKKILVVDDNPVILKATFAFLVSNGYEVAIALDGSEVVACLRQQKPDLILLDIFFPPYVQGGMIWDGFLILDWLRGMGGAKNIPVIIISGADPAKYKDRCLAAGAVAYFQKPLPLRELLSSIRTALDTCAEKNPPEPAIKAA